jgi:hypothetical protein
MIEYGKQRKQTSAPARFLLGFVILIASAVCSTPMFAQAPCAYEVAHIIKHPFNCDAFEGLTVGTAMSPSGRYVVGNFKHCVTSQFRAFLFDTHTQQFIVLPFAESPFTDANDVNEEYVVGQGDGHGFLYKISTGEVTIIPPGVPPSLGRCWVEAINSHNVVCGTRTIQTSPSRTSAFIWSAEKGIVDLGLINDQSTTAVDIDDVEGIVGTMTINGVPKVFKWQRSDLTELSTPSDYWMTPRRMNNAGHVTGSMSLGNFGTPFAFLWSDGQTRTLTPLVGHDLCHGMFVLDDATVVGFSRRLSPAQDRAVLWRDGAIRNLNEMLRNPPPQTVMWDAVSASQTRTILANGIGPTMRLVYVLQPIIAPSADITGDCRVNVADLLLVITEWNKTKSIADINRDSIVNVDDLLEVIQQWMP